MKRALITGVTGQDGIYLTKLLLSKNYIVFGYTRPSTRVTQYKFNYLPKEIELIYGDMNDSDALTYAINLSKPDEIYNLASQSRPSESWINIEETLLTNSFAALKLFEIIRKNNSGIKIFQASSSEMFGKVLETPRSEDSNFIPLNPYGASKVFAHHLARIYRESYNLFIATGILFNHESELRPLCFVVQKIAYGAACAALGIKRSTDLNEKGTPIVNNGLLTLGNLDVARDWGYAEDYVKAMWKILQHDIPDDFVIGTGEIHSLRELCDIAYSYVGKNWLNFVCSDSSMYRPLDTMQTRADPSKANRILDWKPEISFKEMIEKMVNAQIKRLELVK